MTPSSTGCIPNQLNFGTIEGRKVIADFTGAKITSDAGIVLLAELDKKLKISNCSITTGGGRSRCNRSLPPQKRSRLLGASRKDRRTNSFAS
jgi:hypothetical protein